MHLTLVIPGLFWTEPGNVAIQPCTIQTPALNALLGRGKPGDPHLSDLDATLAVQCFGVSPPPPYAALRLLGETNTPTPYLGHWLCADPVHWHLHQDQLILADGNYLQLSLSEAENLSEDLNRHFAHVGKFYVATPTRWYLRVHSPITSSAPPLAAVTGHHLKHQLPEDSTLRHILNEIQMVMHQNPVNQARDAQGLPRINSLWLWGSGELKTNSEPSFNHVYGRHPLLSGLAQHSGADYHTTLPENFERLMRRHKDHPEIRIFILLDHLQNGTHDQKTADWLTQLYTLEKQWFSPLQRAIKHNRAKLTFWGITHHGTLSWQISASHLWKIWRRPKSPLILAAELSNTITPAH